MPKIFLIKDRLQQQQQKLAETQAYLKQKAEVEASFPSSVSPLYEQPLSLIIPKNSSTTSEFLFHVFISIIYHLDCVLIRMRLC